MNSWLRCSGLSTSPTLVLLTFLISSAEAQQFTLTVTPQAVMGVTTAPRHKRRGMPGASLRLGAEAGMIGVFAEATRWFSTSTFCRDGDCDYTVLFGLDVHHTLGRSQIGARAGYGVVGPGRVRDTDRAFRAGATWAHRSSQSMRFRFDLQYENWRLTRLAPGRFGEASCCSHGNMDGVVGSGGIEFLVWQR